MPALNEYAFETLTHILHGAREAFLTAKVRSERDVERAAGLARAWDAARDPSTGIPAGSKAEIEAKAAPIAFADAMNATAAEPEDMAYLTDAYLTALTGRTPTFNDAFARAKKTLGRDDMVDGLVIFAALGSRPDPKGGLRFNEASYR